MWFFWCPQSSCQEAAVAAVARESIEVGAAVKECGQAVAVEAEAAAGPTGGGKGVRQAAEVRVVRQALQVVAGARKSVQAGAWVRQTLQVAAGVRQTRQVVGAGVRESVEAGVGVRQTVQAVAGARESVEVGAGVRQTLQAAAAAVRESVEVAEVGAEVIQLGPGEWGALLAQGLLLGCRQPAPAAQRGGAFQEPRIWRISRLGYSEELR
ncbi:hypothetical protein B0H14DRAFT_2591671 [Mycena olivaceomarginata]|nr:hypothetical protein B0H14DRAFT_2591671 [Mycena olivaceomarginata]